MNKEQIAAIERRIALYYKGTRVTEVFVTHITKCYKENEYRVYFEYELPNNTLGRDNIYCNIQVYNDTEIRLQEL